MKIQTIISALFTGIFGSTLALSAVVVPTENQICTRDLNPWRQASNCSCPLDTHYDQRIGYCVEGSAPRISALGEIRTDVVAIGGETTGVLLKGLDRKQFELVLSNQLLEEIQGLEKKDQLFEVRGEYIELPGIEISRRPAIIVNSIDAL